MSYTYLLEGGAESSAGCFSDIAPCVQSRLNRTAGRSCCNDNAMESCPGSRSGTTSEPSTESRGKESPTSCVVGSHVKTSARQVKGLESKVSNLDSGQRWQESFAMWALDSCSWKTRQLSLLGGSVEFSGTWPEWGSMRSGVVYRRHMPDSLTEENASGYLPTPSGTSNHGKNHVSGRLDEWGGSSNPFRGSEIGKLHCPRFEEWMMDWPDQWTELTPLGMDKFRQWLHSHGISCQESVNE